MEIENPYPINDNLLEQMCPIVGARIISNVNAIQASAPLDQRLKALVNDNLFKDLLENEDFNEDDFYEVTGSFHVTHL
jgi:hypothetical protein